MDALNALKRARAGMLVTSPFFGEAALNLVLKEDKMDELPPHRRTMWTDGVTLGYSPEYVLRESMEVLEFSVAHEAMHCVLGHQLRRNGRNPQTWNEACDYSVNWVLSKSGYKVPKWALLDPKYANKAAEEVFELLQGKKEQEQEQKKKEEKKSNEPEEDKDDSEESGQGDQEPEDNEDTDENGSDDSGEESGQGEDSDTGEGQDGGEGSGSGEGEGGEEGEGMGDCEGGCGEIRDFPGGEGMDKGDAQAAHDQEWKSLAAMAQAHAEGCGRCPGYISQMIPELNATKVDWREVLQRFVAERAKNDYSWNRPNARYAGSGFILPSLWNEELPPIGFAIDTSGSTAQDLSQFASEAEEVLNLYPTTLHVVMTDTEVRDVKEYSREDIPLNLEFKGGGGTAFSPTFKYFNDLDVPPTCVIYLTDLQCWDFGPEPDYPVLWIQTDGYRTSPPPWGEVVRMKPRF